MTALVGARLRPGPVFTITIGRRDRDHHRDHRRVLELWETAEVALLDLEDAGGLSPRAAERIALILADERPYEAAL